MTDAVLVPPPPKPTARQRFVIYGLFDPFDGELRYIGKSKYGESRLRTHVADATLKSDTHKNHWIKSVLKHGGVPFFGVLQEFFSEAPLSDAERYWISHFRAAGCRLTNGTDGGEGASGRILSPETHAKMSASQRKRKATAETKARMSAALRLRPPPSMETRDKLSAVHAGKPKSKSAIEKMAAAQRKRLADPINRLRHARERGARPFVDGCGRRYEALYMAAEQLGVPQSSICAVLKGRQKSTNGHSFTYVIS